MYCVEGGREGGGSAALQDRDKGLIPVKDSSNAETVDVDGILPSVRVPYPPLLPSPPTPHLIGHIVNDRVKKKKKKKNILPPNVNMSVCTDNYVTALSGS